LWFWIPGTEPSIDHLAIFLSSFRTAPEVIQNEMALEIRGPHANALSETFQRNFIPLTPKMVPSEETSMAILRFKAGSLNSRKSMISPYLPRLIP
jgi:hypothetical protein